ncbi:DUF3592 domain-containing protein [Roseomonas rosulenta]|uniref:DUF3592 domain-containing protein n=1 Tax=Roseomonas rosulenta TaxID=2748667 RepID=UPI0018DFD510|nr:DUF3592 domain-containing protein [Roseomonas rosulenta]
MAKGLGGIARMAGLAAFGLGAILVVQGALSVGGEAARLASRGVQLDAVVTGIEAEAWGSRGHRLRTAVLTWRDGAGTAQTARLVRAEPERRYRLGERTAVVVDPADPGRAAPPGLVAGAAAVQAWSLWGVALVCAGLAWLVWRRA